MKSPRVLASVVSLAALIVSASCTPTSNVPAVTGSAPSTTSSPVGHDDAAIEEAERAYIDMVVAAAKTNLKSPPKLWTQVAIESTKQVPAFFAEIEPFLKKELPNDGPRVKAALDGAVGAFASFGTYLEHEVLPRSNGEFAAGRA